MLDVPLPDVGSTVGADLLGAAIADARAELGGGSTAPPLRRPPRWPGFGPQLVASVRRHSVVAPAALRVGIAVAIGVGLGRAAGLGHAYWVGLTVAAVLQGSNLSVTRSRVVHRVVGTAIGVGVAFAVLGWGPPLWVVVLVAAVCQGLVELVIATHYGLAVVAITVLALMLFHIGAPAEDVGGSMVARLVDTGLGAALALLLRQVLWPRATSRRVPEIQARTVRAIRDVLDAAWTHGGSEALAGERRRLQGDLAALRAVHADALADSGSQAAGRSRWRSRSWGSSPCPGRDADPDPAPRTRERSCTTSVRSVTVSRGTACPPLRPRGCRDNPGPLPRRRLWWRPWRS